ncbi:hypothetical protein [Pedobacter nototheniae]|uniref:hypothetical protein n=1 Tax=Pedobacter nototheniae TaxID=2488994 RepID=UPI00292CC3CC|nr:hypothetical protein [Pedobacter nototheniae]
MIKLTEDETVIILAEHLKQNGWIIESFCLGQTRGNDIVASKLNTTLVIEAKGARAGDKSPTKKREYFDCGQIKTHFGKALVKILDEKHRNPQNEFAIAHPDDKNIRKAIGHLKQFLKVLEIKHFWVSANGTVIEE